MTLMKIRQYKMTEVIFENLRLNNIELKKSTKPSKENNGVQKFIQNML